MSSGAKMLMGVLVLKSTAIRNLPRCDIVELHSPLQANPPSRKVQIAIFLMGGVDCTGSNSRVNVALESSSRDASLHAWMSSTVEPYTLSLVHHKREASIDHAMRLNYSNLYDASQVVSGS